MANKLSGVPNNVEQVAESIAETKNKLFRFLWFLDATKTGELNRHDKLPKPQAEPARQMCTPSCTSFHIPCPVEPGEQADADCADPSRIFDLSFLEGNLEGNVGNIRVWSELWEPRRGAAHAWAEVHLYPLNREGVASDNRLC